MGGIGQGTDRPKFYGAWIRCAAGAAPLIEDFWPKDEHQAGGNEQPAAAFRNVRPGRRRAVRTVDALERALQTYDVTLDDFWVLGFGEGRQVSALAP